MAALSQAMSDYCDERDCPMLKKHGKQTRCNAMLALGFPSEELHNGFCPIPLDLGIGETTPRDRIAHTRRITSDLKSSLYVSCVVSILHVLSMCKIILSHRLL